MDSRSSDQSDSPKRLKTLASSVQFSGGNTLLHRLVLENSHPDDAGSEIYMMRAMLISMFDVPGSAVNALNDEGFTALHLAVLKNNLLLVTNLLSYLTNIDVNTKCGRGDGNATLHLAVELGHLSIIHKLSMFDVPASAVNALNDEGYTALHLAVLNNDLEMVEKLLSCLANIDVNARRGRDDGNTALHLAVESGHLSIIQELLDKGAGIDIPNDRNYETPLTLAMKLRALDTVKILVGADVNQLIIVGTPLHYAARCGSLEIAEFLIDAGADIDDARGFGEMTPLHHAACYGNLDIVKLLVGKGADLHAADRSGMTPLHLAAMVRKLECVEFLLDQGAHLNATAVFGFTPLHVAAYNGGNVDVVRALVGRGADVNVRDIRGRTPLDFARRSRNQMCIDALQNVG